MADTPQPARSGTHHAVLAGFLGWTLDAFDFFIVVFLFDTLAHQFGVSKKEIVFTTTATLAMRPIGALLFGLLADRYGRRNTLMANVIYFSLIELMCGYSIGYLLAAVAARSLLPLWGWRPMFWIGALPALLALYIRTKVPESEAWKQHRAASTGQVLRIVAGEWKRFSYLVVLMTFMMFLSHGTQDLYPDFLKEVHKISAAMVANIAMIYNVGAVVGAIVLGHFSQVAGRRKGMIAALGLSLLLIPLWAFGSGLLAIIAASFLMQAGVQGAWGVIPVHLNELSADAARGLMPGLAYQLGILLASPTNSIQYALQVLFGYQPAIAGFEVVTILTLATLLWRGSEAHSRSFVRRAQARPDNSSA